MTLINLVPDAKGVENIARTFREGIEQAQEKIAAAERVIERFATDDHLHFQFTPEENDAIGEGASLVIDQEEKRIATLQEALDECELSLEANTALEKLRHQRDQHPENESRVAYYDEVIELIGKLANKAGMKR